MEEKDLGGLAPLRHQPLAITGIEVIYLDPLILYVNPYVVPACGICV